MLITTAKRIADAPAFSNFIIAIIVLAGAVVGIQTYPSMVAAHGTVLHAFDAVILWIFVAEIIIKMTAESPKPWRYFFDPWNVFDFLIVAVCFMPMEDASFVAVLRLARLLRVLKLVKALPELQVIVGALLRSIPSMFYISILLFLVFYLYAVLGVFLFTDNDPVHFADLQTSMLSMFRVSTLEDWTDVMYINMYGCDLYGYEGNPRCVAPKAYGWWSAAFFSSFVMMSTFVVLNLFIGVIMNGMEAAQKEVDRRDDGALAGRLASVAEQLSVLQVELDGLVEEARRRKP